MLRTLPLFSSLSARLGAAVLAVGLLLAAPAPALGWAASGTTIAPGVTIGGVAVGDMTQDQAAAAVRAAYTQANVSIRLAGHWHGATPAQLGQTLQLQPALTRAMAVGRDGTAVSPAGTEVDLRVVVQRARLDAWLGALAKTLDTPAVDASYTLVGNRPQVHYDKDGFVVDQAAVRAAIVEQLGKPGTVLSRSIEYRQTFMHAVHAAVTFAELPKVIVIDRSENTLSLYSPRRLVHVWHVATGMPSLPTPLGDYTIATKQVNPTWTPPPNAAWAKGEHAIPPGPNNPLGPRWMGLSANGIGIHGTNNESSIGRYASHGCIRMHVADVKRLFAMVSVGTPVHIVR